MDPSSQHGRHDADVVPVDFRDHATNCSPVQRTVYQVQQHFRYRYMAPVRDLRQRLIVVPRLVHGDQRVLSHRLEVSQPPARELTRADRFGNVVVEVSIPKVEETVDFDLSLTVERLTGRGPHLACGHRVVTSAAGARRLGVWTGGYSGSRPNTASPVRFTGSSDCLPTRQRATCSRA